MNTHRNSNAALATKTSRSGTYALDLPRSGPASEAPSDLIAQELRARLAAMPTAELVGLLRDTTPPPAPVPTAAPTATVRELIRQALGRASMRSQDIVAAVQARRPGTPGPTVRSDLSRMRAEGELRAVGPVRGGKLRTA
jgi:hypothetical protein